MKNEAPIGPNPIETFAVCPKSPVVPEVPYQKVTSPKPESYTLEDLTSRFRDHNNVSPEWWIHLLLQLLLDGQNANTNGVSGRLLAREGRVRPKRSMRKRGKASSGFFGSPAEALGIRFKPHSRSSFKSVAGPQVDHTQALHFAIALLCFALFLNLGRPSRLGLRSFELGFLASSVCSLGSRTAHARSTAAGPAEATRLPQRDHFAKLFTHHTAKSPQRGPRHCQPQTWHVTTLPPRALRAPAWESCSLKRHLLHKQAVHASHPEAQAAEAP